MSDDPRVPPVTDRSQLAPDDREHFDSIATSRGGVRGPFGVLLNRPQLARAVGELGAVVRFQSGLPPALRELAILTTARLWDCAYIWAAHEPIAREVGVSEMAIEVVAAEESTAGLSAPSAAVVDFGCELLDDHDVTEETFRAVSAALDTGLITELTATVGYYSLLACVCQALRVVPDRPVSSF